MSPLAILSAVAAIAATTGSDPQPAAGRDAYTHCPGQDVLERASDITWDHQPSRMENHRVFRNELHVPMPDVPVQISLFSSGGHHDTTTFSLLMTRPDHDRWHVNVVGRSQIWMQGAPPQELPGIDRDLSDHERRMLETMLEDPCLYLGPTFMDDPQIIAGGAFQTLEIDIPGHHWVGNWHGIRTKQIDDLINLIAAR